MRKKYKNYGLWVALVSNMLVGLQLLGLDISSEQYEGIMYLVNAVLTVLAMFGIVSNPEKGKWFKDEEEVEEHFK